MKPDEIIIEYYPKPKSGGMQTGTTPKGIKVTHIATGIYEICEKHRNQHMNKDEAIRSLKLRLNEC